MGWAGRWEGSAGRGWRGRRDVQVLIIPPISSFPSLNRMHTPPPILLLASEMFKVPRQLMLEARDGEDRSHHCPATHHFLLPSAASGARSPCTSLAVILVSFLQMATCGLLNVCLAASVPEILAQGVAWPYIGANKSGNREDWGP